MESYPRVRIKLVENLSRHLVPALTSLGHDVDTVEDEGLAGRPDAAVGEAARYNDRMLFTLDLEFASLRKYPPGSHPGIVLFRPRGSGPLEVNRLVLEFLTNTDVEALRGHIVVVDWGRIRLRGP